MEYQEALKLAYVIHDEIYGIPRTHQEWANAFNIRGRIAKALVKHFE